jgi:hypothetical protein
MPLTVRRRAALGEGLGTARFSSGRTGKKPGDGATSGAGDDDRREGEPTEGTAVDTVIDALAPLITGGAGTGPHGCPDSGCGMNAGGVVVVLIVLVVCLVIGYLTRSRR